MPDVSFVPNGAQFIAYSMCFAVGWILYKQPLVLTCQTKYCWPYLLIAVGIAFPLYYHLWLHPAANKQLISDYLYASGGWLLVFASLGFVLRYADIQQYFLGYCSKTSYWIYLIQLPILMPLYLYLLHIPMSPTMKFFYMITICFALSLLSYELLVKRTWIGWVLNGKRGI